MLAALATNWVFLALRAAVAAVFGIAAILLPTITLHGLVMLFGAYAAVDGALALIVALGARGVPGFGRLLLEAVVRIGVGLFAFMAPGFTALALTGIFAIWAVASGLAAIAVALGLRRDLSGEWPLPVAGAVSVLLGLLLAVLPATPELQWVIGPYALLFGATLLVLALRLRQLAFEMARVLP
jgi:uncharacterized membrane protein HdeD (DUF308 family)